MAIGTNTLGLLFKISADVGQTQAQLKAVTDQLKVGVDGAKGSLSELGSQFKILSGFLEGFVAGGLTGFVEGVIKAATATADWVNELDRAAQATSIEIRTLAQLEGAFKEAGGSLNTMISTFDIFASHLEQAREGNNKLIDLLEKYGIVSKDVTEATDQAVKALGSMTDQTEKARVATELFGKSGAKQILQFKDLKDGIEGVTKEYKGLGDAIDPKLVEAARAYEAESKKLDAALVANRAVIVGIVLPAWVTFNESIRKAMESLTSFQKLAEHAKEALDKFNIGPGLPKPPEHGLEGEVVSEADARASTQAGIAARELEAARKVKDEKVKITKQGIDEEDKALEQAEKELEADRKARGDALIKSTEDNLKELNEAILAASDPAAFAKFKFEMIDFANFMSKEIDGIVQDIARLPQAIPGGGTGIPGLPDPDVIQGQLDAIHKAIQPTFLDELNKAFKDSGLIISDWGKVVSDVLTGVAAALETTFENFILTGKGGADAFRKLAASVIASIAIQSAIKAIFEIAESVKDAALAASWLPFDPFIAGAYAAASALHAKAALQYGIVAAVAGGAGIAIGAAGGLGGGGASAAAGGGGFGGSAAEQQPSPVNINLGGNPVTTLAIAVTNLHNKISSMSPGDVVTVAADQKPEAFATGTLEAGRRNGAFTREFMQISGART